MYDQKIKSTLDLAGDYYQSAEEELLKPAEDIVPYLVCRNAYRAIQNYLTGFLMNHDLKANPGITLKEILLDCRNYDSRFSNLHLDLLYDAHENEDVWMDLDIANQFMKLANQTKQLVVQN
ncbi:MAG: hypothetical protein ABJF04_22240 [Reichenbachiella sp.]|uniref:hypothetical protein n=1 Tax=Reichenbachiella sp. TaxID=2184521 RepID=UPI003264BC71